MFRKISGIIALIVLLVGFFFIYSVYFSYEEQDEISGFPVPKNAVLTKAEESVAIYEWKKASEEDGIPFFYELAIKSEGWSLVEQEGASSYYEKGQNRIDLISQTELLTIRVE
ncbi:hypothetical protein NM897_04750 [Planococcus maritimus]|uniref:hypothetical protein n=1 Tax=Planococcus maritimus TaxID=192421 RepID=UPI003139367A